MLKKTLKAILDTLIVVAMLFASSLAFAREYHLLESELECHIILLQPVDFSVSDDEWWKEKPAHTKKVMSWETRKGRSYLIPALEIPAFLFLLNGVARLIYPNEMENGKKVYATSPLNFWNHLIHGPWVIDQDKFTMNQFNHPYQGSIYHGFARSTGLNYWESLLYDNMGSNLWETAGETTDPSINDQIASGVAGSFLGEALFRMSGLVLGSDGRKPGFWRELSAAIISPPTGINRFAFGKRFKSVFPSHYPATFWRIRLGVNLNTNVNNKSGLISVGRHEATADFIMAYGLHGKSGYTYSRPFDYFLFEFSSLGNLSNPIDNIMIRGLLFGTDYGVGDSYRGIWGLYAGYDYISPYIFRISSTSGSMGTTFQWRLLPTLALQGSVLGGAGYAAAGNVTQVGQRDYHYGVAPQGLLALRFILGDRAMFDVTERVYYLTGFGGGSPRGREMINRLNTGFTFRVYGHHALGVQYIASIRSANYSDRAGSNQSVGTVSIVYTLLSDTQFGVVKW